MKQDLDNLLTAFESGSISRRELIARIASLGILLTGGVSSLSSQTTKKPSAKTLSANGQQPFIDIAKRKGVRITFGANLSKLADGPIHLDMDMVEQSIRDAIRRLVKPNPIADKLQWLLDKGTDTQKVDFVLGSGSYYFPGDIEKLAELSRTSGGRSKGVECRRVCETIYYWVCKCIQRRDDQECRETSRIFCEIRCP